MKKAIIITIPLVFLAIFCFAQGPAVDVPYANAVIADDGVHIGANLLVDYGLFPQPSPIPPPILSKIFIIREEVDLGGSKKAPNILPPAIVEIANISYGSAAKSMLWCGCHLNSCYGICPTINICGFWVDGHCVGGCGTGVPNMVCACLYKIPEKIDTHLPGELIKIYDGPAPPYSPPVLKYKISSEVLT